MILEKAEIFGFREIYSIDAQFDRDINYVIGHNGTGKTTFVKMLVFAAQLNVRQLLLSKFDKIELVFSSRILDDSERLKTLVVYRDTEFQAENSLGYFKVVVETVAGNRIEADSTALRFSRRSRDVPLNHQVVEPHLPELYRQDSNDVKKFGRPSLENARKIRQILEQLHVNWLPIERTLRANSGDELGRQGVDINNPVNHKLNEILRQLVLYSYDLDKRRANSFERFRNLSLLALFNVESKSNKGTKASSKVAVEKLQSEINSLIPELKLEVDLEKDFRNRAGQLVASLSSQQQGRPVEALKQAQARLQEVLTVWSETQETVSALYAKRDAFLKAISEAFALNDLTIEQRTKFAKVPFLADDNEIRFVQNVGHKFSLISPQDLSSGEKQFFIILAEALLERNQETLLIIDEPELSLHVSWQARLVNDIRNLNPSAQIILATHSPDVLQDQRQNIIRMENAVITA